MLEAEVIPCLVSKDSEDADQDPEMLFAQSSPKGCGSHRHSWSLEGFAVWLLLCDRKPEATMSF